MILLKECFPDADRIILTGYIKPSRGIITEKLLILKPINTAEVYNKI